MNLSAKAAARIVVARELDRIEQEGPNPPPYSSHEAGALFLNLRERLYGPLPPELAEKSKREYGV